MNDIASFGFNRTPFTREIAVKNFFKIEAHEEIVEALLEVIDSRMSATLVAPAGAGKTSLLRKIRDRLPEARYRTHYIKVTDLSQRDLCREICMGIGIKPAGNYPALVRNVQSHFENTFDSEGLRNVLIVDECHDLRPSTLKIFRILTNFNMDSSLMLSLILAGQKPLKTMLLRDEAEDITKRMAHYAELRLLSCEDTKRYIKHRCMICGLHSSPFDDSALQAIFEISRGNLRAIDSLALKALLIAAKAKQEMIDQNNVTQARQELWP